MIKNKIMAIDGTWLLRRAFMARRKCKIEGTERQQLVRMDTLEEIDTPIEGVECKEVEKYDQDPYIAVVSTLQSILKLMKDYNYQYRLVMCFDKGTWRYRDKKKNKNYKSTRVYDNTFQACWDANDIIIPVLRSLGIDTVQVAGIEADDLGYYYSYNSDECVLVTSDRDWLLGLRETTQVHRPIKGVMEINLLSEYVDGVNIRNTHDLALLKCLEGDDSDNIQGIKVNNQIETIHMYTDESTRCNIDPDVLLKLDENLSLIRLDQILFDQDVISKIKYCETLTHKVNSLEIINALGSLPDYPVYFNGVLMKYNKLVNGVGSKTNP